MQHGSISSGHRSTRCPFCTSSETAWVEAPSKAEEAPRLRGRRVDAASTLWCFACERALAPTKVDPRRPEPQTWEARAEAHLTCDDFFTPRFGLERAEFEEGAALDRFIAARERAHAATDVGKLFRYLKAEHRDAVPWTAELFWDLEQKLVTEFAKWFFHGRPVSLATLASLGRRAPNRPPFNTIGHALRFHATGSIGMSPVRWQPLAATKRSRSPLPDDVAKIVARLDGNHEAAERHARRAAEIRRTGGMRGGVVHATSSSHNGSVGEAKNQASIGLELDVARALRAAVEVSRAQAKKFGTEPITWSDIDALVVMHADDGIDAAVAAEEVAVLQGRERAAVAPQLDRRGAYESLLRAERLLRGDEPQGTVTAVIAEHKDRLARRLARATEQLEHALRAVPPNALDAAGRPVVPGAEVPLLSPAPPARDRRERRERATPVRSPKLPSWAGQARGAEGAS